ncbi:MAG: GxxExxY protein, partial [Thermoplasmata archaeon]|nr:GxxExxY protein [Thermoplasmata archaeon]
KIIIEIKSEKQLTEIDKAQLHNYLKATGLKLGLLLNFGGPILEIKRIIRSK